LDCLGLRTSAPGDSPWVYLIAQKATVDVKSIWDKVNSLDDSIG